MGFFNDFGKFFSNYGGAIGSIAGGALSYYGQNSANQANRDIARETNATNMALAQKQMEFQERMSNTSFQRGVSDMLKAGINPILAATQGGASSPSGAAVGAVTGAPVMNALSGAQEAVSSAIQSRIQRASLDQIRANTQKTMSDIDLNNVLKVASMEDANLKSSNAKVARATADSIKLAQPGLKVEQSIDESRYGRILRYLGRLNPFGHSAGVLAKVLK